MNSKQEAFVVVLVTLAVVFGSVAGGATALLLTLPQVAQTPALNEETATERVARFLVPSVVSVIAQEKENGVWIDVGGGTGVIVSTDGLVLTNRHVIDQQSVQFLLITSDGLEHSAVLVDSDPFLDMGVLRFVDYQPSLYPPAVLGDSSTLRVGQTVIAIGNTLSEFPHSVTRGIISGLDRTIVAGSYFSVGTEVIDHAIQTDAAISEGNSGGPLVNLDGEVIGINTAVSMDGQSLGFAIPINSAQAIISDIEQYGHIVRPWLGVQYQMIDRDVRNAYQLTQSDGAYILPDQIGQSSSVIAGSPAEKAGLKAGDIILDVNQQVVDAAAPLGEVINQYNPGDTVTLRIDRQTEILFLNVTLEEVDQTKF